MTKKTGTFKRTLLKSKIHRARVTDANVAYEGSVTIDPELMKAADLWPFERVEIYNITNGARLATYVIEGTPGAREICINGAAAHLVKPDDRVIICSYVEIENDPTAVIDPMIILVDENNEPKKRLTI